MPLLQNWMDPNNDFGMINYHRHSFLKRTGTAPCRPAKTRRGATLLLARSGRLHHFNSNVMMLVFNDVVLPPTSVFVPSG